MVFGETHLESNSGCDGPGAQRIYLQPDNRCEGHDGDPESGGYQQRYRAG